MPLSAAQERVALILLSAGAGQLALAGGSALIAHGLIDRMTRDLDAFTAAEGYDLIELARRAENALVAAGYSVSDDTRVPAVQRLLVQRFSRSTRGRPASVVQVELCRDDIALPSVPSPLGPLLDPLELGANKILAV